MYSKSRKNLIELNAVNRYRYKNDPMYRLKKISYSQGFRAGIKFEKEKLEELKCYIKDILDGRI